MNQSIVSNEAAGKTLLVLGGTSDIGRFTALAFARQGWSIQLAGRNLDDLQREAADIATRTNRPVSVHRFDVLDSGSFEAFIASLPEMPEAVVSVIGYMGSQEQAQSDLEQAATVMRSNFEGPSLILGQFANSFITRGHGVLIGVSSVAGDRGRASNYIYGSAKAGFTAFLSGLRNRCAKKGVQVLTVKPGFVRTKMTANLNLPGALTAEPETVGEAIYRAMLKKRNTIYVLPIWQLVMLIIRNIPEAIFKKLSL